MKNIIILGSTGSIGRQTLEAIRWHPDVFKVAGLSSHSNYKLLEKQAREFNPSVVAISDSAAATKLKRNLVDTPVEVINLEEMVRFTECDLVVNALVGSSGLIPTLRAIEASKDVALANKESLVVGGEIVVELARDKEARILPIDSEHSAIFQCLQGEDSANIRRIILTGSGGPFRGRSRTELKNVTVEEALAHPRWKMGAKISIDSATLMNKGLEVIEAHFLFGVAYDSIEVVIHPQSIIHSMVEFKDGSIKAHLGITDMRIPILYALGFPERLTSPLVGLDFFKMENLTFETPDLVNFPCLEYALEAGRKGKTYLAVLNAANEEAVAAFLDRRIGFLEISEIIYQVLAAHIAEERLDLEVLLTAEQWARERARALIRVTK